MLLGFFEMHQEEVQELETDLVPNMSDNTFVENNNIL
jgi:hypothetical protein